MLDQPPKFLAAFGLILPFLATFRPQFFLLLFISTANAGIEITDIFVPRVLLVGEDAELECRFLRTNGVDLYSIKWWRDNDQFYQYIPRYDPAKMPFNVSGIRVDTLLSSEVKVFLRHVTVETSGAFTCEVMADESFETVRRTNNMTVIDPPDGDVPGTFGPVIEVSGVGPVGKEPLEYHSGKMLEALCVARRTYPPATLAWTINGREAADDFLTRVPSRQEKRNSYTTQLWLAFTVTEELFDSHGQLLLVCNASLGSHFEANATLTLRNPLMRRALNSGLFSSGTGIESSLRLIVSTAIVLYILHHDFIKSFSEIEAESNLRCPQIKRKKNDLARQIYSFDFRISHFPNSSDRANRNSNFVLDLNRGLYKSNYAIPSFVQ